MYIARILYPVKVLGPGDRIGIWFDGCPRRCKNCSNPELWEFDKKYEVTLENVTYLIKEIASNNQVDGFTITGGDPFYQDKDLVDLLKYLVNISEDILVYTGYKYEEINDNDLSNIAVLIDGEYIEEKNQGEILRGSKNQNIIVLKEKYQLKYDEYLKNKSKIQNFRGKDNVFSLGIHKKGFKF